MIAPCIYCDSPLHLLCELWSNNTLVLSCAALCSQVTWHAVADSVPRTMPVLFIAHEFFDALPVHQFVKDPRCAAACYKAASFLSVSAFDSKADSQCDRSQRLMVRCSLTLHGK